MDIVGYGAYIKNEIQILLCISSYRYEVSFYYARLDFGISIDQMISCI